MGGRFPGALPKARRIIPLVSAFALLVFVLIVETRARVILPDFYDVSRTAVWAVVGYCGLGVFANALTPSREERRLWLPVVLAMLASSAVVALG